MHVPGNGTWIPSKRTHRNSTNHSLGCFKQAFFLQCGIRDRSSVNNVAMHTNSIMYPLVLDIGCFSHTLNNVGEQFQTPALDKFMKHWQAMFSHSHKARLLWHEQTRTSLRTYSATHWWSRWECEKQVLELWGDVPKFLTDNTDIAPRLCAKLTQLATKSKELAVELVITFWCWRGIG